MYSVCMRVLMHVRGRCREKTKKRRRGVVGYILGRGRPRRGSHSRPLLDYEVSSRNLLVCNRLPTYYRSLRAACEVVIICVSSNEQPNTNTYTCLGTTGDGTNGGWGSSMQFSSSCNISRVQICTYNTPSQFSCIFAHTSFI